MTARLHPATRALIALAVATVALGASIAWAIDTQPPPTRPTPQLLPIEPTLPTFAPTPATPRAVELAHATTGPTPSRRPVVAPPAWARCPQWWRAAQRAGWTAADMATLDLIMWGEARCQPKDVSRTNDHGLTQINARHLATPGYAQLCARSRGRICTTADLAKPRRNLRAARILADVADDWFGCKWQPWRVAGRPLPC